MKTVFSEAKVEDISQIMEVRFSVRENVLANPGLVTEKDCEEYITVRGKGWKCKIDDVIVGFSIADLRDHNIWALFVNPDYEGKGIGKKLHDLMLDWYFSTTTERVWLSTSPGTRAEKFYRKAGWKETGKQPNGELRFEFSWEDWKKLRANIQVVEIDKPC